MYLHKIRHPANFVFARRVGRAGRFSLGSRRFQSETTDLGDEMFKWSVSGPEWKKNHSQAGLTPPRASERSPSRCAFSFGQDGGVSLADGDGQVLLEASPGQGFGVAGGGWVMQFLYHPDCQFYGMGEKNNGFEKSHKRTKFWNTDVFGDFGYLPQIEHGVTDPMYVSIPYLIVKRGNRYTGLLVNNPHAVFMDTDSNYHFAGRPNDYTPRFWIGCEEGKPEVYVIDGPSLPELTRKLQRLCGVTPRPPLWALGHHQCRWGYRGTKDLLQLDQDFRKHGIPCDGLWLDIDYMDAFKVFTFDPAHFGDVAADLAELRRRGRRVVPILDPGVKLESGYEVYDEGSRLGCFCLNLEKREFVGHVWPGETVFPDFSRADVRAWWARHVAEFARQGVSGAWIDMNDPSLSGTEPFDMLFNRGRETHTTYHNQYALGMAQATREGFLQAEPERRPFVISRSGFIGQSRHSALWTGDNFSNYHHLRQSIPVTLNLALSGVPFNGPDVPGFAGSATRDLAIAWYKAGFLFPFFRNHSILKSSPQEPWRFGASATRIIGHYIRLRYKLLPYLYNLFVEQERVGEAILRPLFHDYEDTAALPLGMIDDQFLVGRDILQAPVVVEKTSGRELLLPGSKRWFCARTGRWEKGAQRIRTATTEASTPLYIREGAIVPMQAGERKDATNDLANIELHVFLAADSEGSFTTHYTCDDGESFAYRTGGETRLRITATCKGGELRFEISAEGAVERRISLRPVLYARFRSVACVVNGRAQALRFGVHRWKMTGGPLRTYLAREAVTIR
ncbi:MAG: DUF5110 domain-containing protein [Burkholderiales bacterium]|nr:DUF5110 domain-containing protein [Opitutaceae bacterium]